MTYPCPNCGTPLKRVLPSNGGYPWQCTVQCEDETDMTKEIQEISKGSTTGIKRRWIVPGSGKMSYTVAQWSSPYQGQLFSCSCPAWTRNMPRTDCKHVLRTKAEMNIGIGETLEAYAAHAKILKSAFEGYVSPANSKIKNEPKQKTVVVTIPTHTPKTSGRKFR